jgi:hypothetical protein
MKGPEIFVKFFILLKLKDCKPILTETLILKAKYE